MDLDFYEQVKTHEQTKRFYTLKPRSIMVEDVHIKIQLKEEDYDSMFKRIVVSEKKLIHEDLAVKWIENNIVGDITKEKLDDQRHQEITNCDMMQNTSIIYHMESVIEMQIMCLIFIMVNTDIESASGQHSNSLNVIIAALILEHVFSYITGIFRKWEI